MRSDAKLFESVRIGNMEVKNRLVMPPMVTNFCGEDGSMTDRYISFMRDRAKGGAGLLITEATFVHPSGKSFPHGLGIYRDESIPGLKKLTDAVHAEGAKIAVQLFHGGRQCVEAITGMRLLAPSAIACPVCGDLPGEMTAEDIAQIKEAFGDAAVRAKQAGFDAIELHGAHGYLLCEFLSPYSNHRTDEYGGSLVNRARFPLEVVETVRARVGEDFPLSYRLSAEEYVPGGLTLDETAAFAQMLVNHGVDAIHVSGGVYQSADMLIPGASLPQGVFVENAAAIKTAIGGKVPVIVAGRLNDPAVMAETVASGKADLIATGRGLLADPNLPLKLEKGLYGDIVKCTACNLGCTQRIFAGKDIRCVQNPSVGREWEA